MLFILFRLTLSFLEDLRMTHNYRMAAAGKIGHHRTQTPLSEPSVRSALKQNCFIAILSFIYFFSRYLRCIGSKRARTVQKRWLIFKKISGMWRIAIGYILVSQRGLILSPSLETLHPSLSSSHFRDQQFQPQHTNGKLKNVPKSYL